MPDEPNDIPAARFARWILLVLLVAAGVVLYLRDGTRLPSFGSAATAPPPPPPSAPADTTR
jgi:hypothetical protein